MNSTTKRVKGIRNFWYIAAHSSELTDKPIGRTILGTGIVFYRDSKGRVVALRDACGHRFAPLSRGKVVGDTLECPYHGAIYAGTGECIEFSGEPEVPKRCNIAAFPVTERHDFIWVWIGAPAKADPDSIPDIFGRHNYPHWTSMDGQFISFQSHYSLIVDNLFDSSHAKYVHPTTLGAPGLLAQRGDESLATFDAEIGESAINYIVDIANGAGGQIIHDGLGKRMGIDSYMEPVDWHLEVAWAVPAFFVFDSDAKVAGADKSESARFCTFHAITPETETSCHYFYRTVERLDEGLESLCQFWHEGTTVAFNEDKNIIEAQQAVIGEQKPFDSDTWGVFKVDELGMVARNMIRQAEAAN